MNTKTLTLTIEGIPEDFIKIAENAKNSMTLSHFGMVMQPMPDTVTATFDEIEDCARDSFNHFMTTILTVFTKQQFEKYLNK